MAVSLEAWGPPFPMHHLCTLHHGTGCLCLASPENQLHVCWRDGCVLWAAEAWEIVGGFDPLSHPDTPVPPFRLPPGARAVPLAHSLSGRCSIFQTSVKISLLLQLLPSSQFRGLGSLSSWYRLLVAQGVPAERCVHVTSSMCAQKDTAGRWFWILLRSEERFTDSRGGSWAGDTQEGLLFCSGQNGTKPTPPPRPNPTRAQSWEHAASHHLPSFSHFSHRESESEGWDPNS